MLRYIIKIFILIFIPIITLRTFHKRKIIFAKKKKDFESYLYEKGDFETLKAIGATNYLEEKDSWWTSYSQVVCYLKNKIKENKDEIFSQYLADYNDFNLYFLILLIPCGLSLSILFSTIKELLNILQ